MFVDTVGAVKCYIFLSICCCGCCWYCSYHYYFSNYYRVRM